MLLQFAQQLAGLEILAVEEAGAGEVVEQVGCEVVLALARVLVEADRLVEHAALDQLLCHLQLVLDAAADRQLLGLALHVAVRVDRLDDVVADLLEAPLGAAARQHLDDEIDQRIPGPGSAMMMKIQ